MDAKFVNCKFATISLLVNKHLVRRYFEILQKIYSFSLYYFLLVLVTIGDFCLEQVLSFYPLNVNFLFSLCFLHLLIRNSTLRKSCIFSSFIKLFNYL